VTGSFQDEGAKSCGIVLAGVIAQGYQKLGNSTAILPKCRICCSAVLPHPVAIRLEQRRLNRLGLVLVDRSENSSASKILVEGTNTFASISSKASFRAWAITLIEVTLKLLKKLGRKRLQTNVIVPKKRE
jgi:hypothetical protein